jgi:predicted metalloprotease
MRWNRDESDQNVEDRRDETGGGGGGFSGGGGMKLGIGGVIVVGLLSLVFRQNFFALLDSGGSGPAPGQVSQSGPRPPSAPRAHDPKEEERKKFVTFVLNDTQRTWAKLLPASSKTGRGYTDAHLVLFRDAIRSACGNAESSSGPFYCPGDQKVYIDLGFYDELARKFGAPGEFAQAYVIAHEIGHHVQNLTGIEAKVRQQQQSHPDRVNDLSVRLELQADCLAGVWGNSANKSGILDPGDLEAGLNAASAIGDDRLQKMARGRVSPESFTHGSSKQRVEWFRKGFDAGNPNACDTFRAPRL